MSSELKNVLDQIDGRGYDTAWAITELNEKFVIIPRADLPSVKRGVHDPNAYYTDNENVVFTSAENGEMWVMRDIAVWQFIVNESSAKANRREELAAELSPLIAATFAELSATAKNAINRIIELEAQK